MSDTNPVSGGGKNIRVALGPVVDADSIAAHLAELRAAIAADGAVTAVTILCDAVEQIGLAGLQLLASAARSCAERGLALAFERPSDRLIATAELAGMRSILLAGKGCAS